VRVCFEKALLTGNRLGRASYELSRPLADFYGVRDQARVNWIGEVLADEDQSHVEGSLVENDVGPREDEELSHLSGVRLASVEQSGEEISSSTNIAAKTAHMKGSLQHQSKQAKESMGDIDRQSQRPVQIGGLQAHSAAVSLRPLQDDMRTRLRDFTKKAGVVSGIASPAVSNTVRKSDAVASGAATLRATRKMALQDSLLESRTCSKTMMLVCKVSTSHTAC
jgi:hypothetical protein